MTTKSENETLTRVGAGTPMGDLMRQYWPPAAKSDELIADGDPLRLMLLGEKLIAFRDSSGRVGVMDHRCPHRCASLFFGRNEENGIRCVYHGWKFDVDGNCLDMANVPPHQDFKHKVKAKAYKAAERNGLVWVFMGDQDAVPHLPDIEATLVPEAEMGIVFNQRECNWLQAIEGELDTSHIGFLLYASVGKENFGNQGIRKYSVANRAPEYVSRETDWGFMYAAHRPGDDANTYWRVAQFLMPFWSLPPINQLEINFLARAWVPIDGEHTMIVLLMMKGTEPTKREALTRNVPGSGLFPQLKPNSTDWHGRWRTVAGRGNDYLIDRAVQRSESFTGIDGITMQDHAITESMGAYQPHPRASGAIRHGHHQGAPHFGARRPRPCQGRSPPAKRHRPQNLRPGPWRPDDGAHRRRLAKRL
jgi:phthalate 4,5-dioxygenase oxygenase subunit